MTLLVGLIHYLICGIFSSLIYFIVHENKYVLYEKHTSNHIDLLHTGRFLKKLVSGLESWLSEQEHLFFAESLSLIPSTHVVVL